MPLVNVGMVLIIFSGKLHFAFRFSEISFFTNFDRGVKLVTCAWARIFSWT